MRFSTFAILAIASSAAAVGALELPDASEIGTLPAFLRFSDMVAHGSRDAEVLSQFKALAQKLTEQGTDLHKVLGDDVETYASFLGLQRRATSDLLDADEVGTLPAFLQAADLLAKGSQDSEVASTFKTLGEKLMAQGTDINKILGTAPEVDDLFKLLGLNLKKRSESELSDPKEVGTLPAFLEATDLLAKGSRDLKVITQFKTLGAELKKSGTDLHKVLGDAPEVMSLFELLGLEKRSTIVEDVGKVPAFISLLSELETKSEDDSDYEETVAKFLKLGKAIQADGGSLVKMLGTSDLGKAYAEAFATPEKGIENGVKEVAKAAQRLAGRDAHRAQSKRRHHGHLEKM